RGGGARAPPCAVLPRPGRGRRAVPCQPVRGVAGAARGGSRELAGRGRLVRAGSRRHRRGPTVGRRAALVLVRAGALPRGPPASRGGVAAGRRPADTLSGTRPLLACDVPGPPGRDGGSPSGGRGERGDPAGNGRRLGGSHLRARRARPVLSARG